MSRLRARLIGVFAPIFLLTTLSAIPAFAQDATLSGTVTDSTGGVLPGVTITAIHEATGNTFLAVTDGGGTFRLPVRTGLHRVTAELAGFSTVTQTVNLLVGQNAVVNLQMSPSTIQETVTVTGEAPLIDTANSSLASNVDPRQMQDLPVNGRNWMDLTLLAPGSRSNSISETPIASSGSNVPFQLNLDGQQVTNLVAVGFGQPRYSRDAIGEFEFVSNRFDAAQGRSSGIQVNAITKSGTNTPGGTFSGYFRNDRFNAADPVVGEVLPYSDQQISTTFGGPIRRDRIHFFLSYEYEREPQTYVYRTAYPHFNGSLTGARRQDTELARFDFQFSPSTRLTIRGNRYDNRIPYDARYTGGSDRTPASAIGVNRRSEQEFADFTQVLNATTVNQVKGGHSVFHWNQYPHVKNANALIGQLKGLGAPVIQMNGLTIGQTHAITPQDIGQEIWSVRDDLTTSATAHGRHDLRIGGEYMHDFTFETVCQTCMGQLDLRGGPIPANIESFFPDINDVTTWNLAPLSPLARTYIRNIATERSQWSRPAGNNGFTEYAPRHVMALWGQDDWAVGSRLTLNLGVRYDAAIGEFVNWVAFPPFIEANRPNDLNNVAPRLGFTYALTDRTVIRGGAGKYFGEATSQPALFTLRYVQQVAAQVAYDGRPDFASNPFNGPAPTYEQAVQKLCANQPNPLASNCIRANTSNFAAPDLVDPYSWQTSVGVQHQLGTSASFEADWVFSADRAAFNTRNINIAYNPATGANYPLVGSQAAANYKNRPYPGWGNITMNRSDGRANYHALQTALTKRMANRWQASATYTLAGRWQYDSLPLNPGCQYPVTINAAGAAVCDVPITLAKDITEDDWYLTGDQRHRATLNGIWEMGYGFQLSGLYIFGDNGFATPTSGVDVRSSQNSGGRLRANGTLIDRNSFNLPAIHRVDMRLQRRFVLSNRVRIDGIFEMYNVFNRDNFESFTINEANRQFGKPLASTSLAYQPRMLQLGFRAQF